MGNSKKNIPLLLLGLSPVGKDQATGIHRVAHHLLTGLAQSPEINAQFHPCDFSYESMAYYEKHLLPLGSDIIVDRRISRFFPLQAKLRGFIISSFDFRSPYYRLVRKIFSTGVSLIDGISRYLISGKFRGIDAYHSPFLLPPRSIRENNDIARFTTIYDLIAITNPEFFTEGLSTDVRNLIDGLTEDDFTFSISCYTREALLANSKCLPERSFVARLAASEHFHPLPEGDERSLVLSRHGLRHSGYILSLCTLEIRKNIDQVIRAFIKLHAENRLPEGTKLVLVGGKGWKTQNVDRALESADRVRDLIVMPGYVPDEDLAAIYSAARLFTYMSFAEGFGLPPLEAMQCGIPVITSNTTSLPEVVGEAGIMLPPDDLEGLCDSIEKLYDDDILHASLCEKSLARAKLFSWKRYIDETISGYHRGLEIHREATRSPRGSVPTAAR